MGPVTGAGMADVTLRYVEIKRDRHGDLKYYYFRRNGRRFRLPGPLLSSEFMAAYSALLADLPANAEPTVADRRNHLPGTFGALVREYLASASFKEKANSTQTLYRRALDKLSAESGTKPVRLLKRRHIRKMRDAMSDTPGAANNVLRLLKIVLNFAVEEEIIEVNPAARVKELKGGEYRSWTDEECAAFEKRWLAGTMERRAYALALYTGQRRADLVAMTRAHRTPEERLHSGFAGKDGSGAMDRRAQCANYRADPWRPKPHESANHIEGQSLRLNLLWRVVCRGDRQCRTA